MNESYKKIYILYMNIRSINAANCVWLQASVNFITIPAQQAFNPYKKESLANNFGGNTVCCRQKK